MARIIAETRLKKAIKDGTFIKNGLIDNAEGIKYDFRMSSRILKAEFGRAVNMSKFPEQQQAGLAVEPGEVVFVLTEEILDLPRNIEANLSPKRKLSHQGIMVLGGFCIDPLYKGRLLIGLYNFSSSSFPLIPGKKLIAAVFYELQDEEIDDFKRPEAAIDDFPDELIRLMKSYRPVSSTQLIEQMKKLQADFDGLRNEFRGREDWFERFEEAIGKHDKLISKILEGLEKEKDQRVEAERSFRREIGTYARRAYMTAGIVGTLGALIISGIVFLVQKLLLNN